MDDELDVPIVVSSWDEYVDLLDSGALGGGGGFALRVGERVGYIDPQMGSATLRCQVASIRPGINGDVLTLKVGESS